MTSAIWGLGMDVPERVLDNDHFVGRMDTTHEWIQTRTGILGRHIASDGEYTSTFAIAASAAALKDAGLTPTEIDQVIVATCTPDMPVPGAAPFVQAALGASNASAFDLNAGCTGFVTALAQASNAVTAGAAKHVLVCGAETLSSITDYEDRGTCVLFGDGAGAVIVGPSESQRIGPTTFGCEGERWDLLCVPAGGSRDPISDQTLSQRTQFIQMKGQDVYKHACERMTSAVRAVCDDVGELELVVAHQANARIITTVGKRLGLREDQVFMNVADYGNTSAASIPIALNEARDAGRLEDGMDVVLVAFGAGFSWGAVRTRWGKA